MKRPFLRAGVLAGVLSLYLAATAGAAVLLSDGFSYPDGNLVGNGGWAAHDSPGGLPIQVQSGEAVVATGSGAEDINTALSGTRSATDVTYVSFKLKVGNGAALGAGDYMAHFRFSGNFIYPGRVYIAAPTLSGYQLGIRATSTGTTVAFWPSDLAFDTYYDVVVRFTATTGDATLWVNPADELASSVTSAGGVSAAVGAQIDQYALRQGSSNVALHYVDDLLVGESFGDVVPAGAPGASTAGMVLLASLMLGAGALFVVRRRATVA